MVSLHKPNQCIRLWIETYKRRRVRRENQIPPPLSQVFRFQVVTIFGFAFIVCSSIKRSLQQIEIS